jgi:hypothetical protein
MAKRSKPTQNDASLSPASSTGSLASLTYFSTTSSQAAYDHFIELATQVPLEGLEVCRADVELVRSNLQRGVDAILPHVQTVQRKLPENPITEVLELPALGLALLYAANRVARPVSPGEIERRLEEISTPREAGLKQLEVFALLGLIPTERVEAVRRGRGPLDKARDAVAIPGMFREFDAVVAGKHPLPAAMLANLATHGDWLVQQIQPIGVPLAPAEREPAALVRDQMWALIRQRHEYLREAGVVVFGIRSVDDHIPLLASRVGQRRANSEIPGGGTGTPGTGGTSGGGTPSAGGATGGSGTPSTGSGGASGGGPRS